MSRELPIIFDTESVDAILAGRKTQMRRVIDPQPPKGTGNDLIVAKQVTSKIKQWWKKLWDEIWNGPDLCLEWQCASMEARALRREAEERQKLSDEFAKAALTGLCVTDNDINVEKTAAFAYKMADAMLAEREAGNE